MHPRVYGTFVRLFERYVRAGVLPVHKAVQKVTGLPAARLRLSGKGMTCSQEWTRTSMCSRWKDFMRRERISSRDSSRREWSMYLLQENLQFWMGSAGPPFVGRCWNG